MLHVDDLFNNPDIIKFRTHPEPLGVFRYCAKSVVTVLGRKWVNSAQTLRPIPECHKGILYYQDDGGDQNVWCLSRIGVLLFHQHVTGHYPVDLSAQECTEIDRVISLGDESTEENPTYAELLADARQRPSPLTLMLLLDDLTLSAIEHLEAFRTKTLKIRKGIKHPSTQDILPLIQAMPDDEQEEVIAYIDWLINEEEVTS